jgi:hypothetical protein
MLSSRTRSVTPLVTTSWKPDGTDAAMRDAIERGTSRWSFY